MGKSVIVYLCIHNNQWDDMYAVCTTHERAKSWAFEVMEERMARAIRDVDQEPLRVAMKKRDLDQAIHLWDRFTDGEESFLVMPTDLIDHTVEEKLECKSGS